MPDKASKLQSLQSELGQTSLLIVSKTRPLQDIVDYYQLGHRDFGENRVQELQEKAEALRDRCPEIRWHMIGHLQSNKINALYSVPGLFAIHSVHDDELLQKLLKAEDRLAAPVNLFLQYNTSREEEKSGFESYETLKTSAQKLLAAKNLRLYGLMTMGTLRTENFEAEAARCFQELNSLKSRLSNDLGSSLKTSMGMSQDYRIALKEKSDWIRLGTMMFV